MNKIKHTGAGDRVFDFSVTVFMLIMILVTVYPLYYVIVASFSDNVALMTSPGLLIWPRGFGTGAYRLAFQHPLVISGYRNTMIILLFSIPLNLIMTWLCGYFLAAKNVMAKKPIQFVILFTMFFSGGMIPAFLNIHQLGLANSLAALILPGALSVFNAIICRTAIESIPISLSESAYIDGANDFTVLFRIIIPLIMPTTAVLILYYGVGHWNSWFPASLYITDNLKLPIQNILRSVLIATTAGQGQGFALLVTDHQDNFAEAIKYSIIVITTLPILLVYPFLQKYFVKGVMLGAVKG